MSLVVHQHITIHNLRVSNVTNSSILQIGAAGIVRSLASINNTGGIGIAQQAGTGTGGGRPPLVPMPQAADR